jgi:hypothetical protein
LAGNGQTIANAATTLTAGGRYVYNTTTTVWYNA